MAAATALRATLLLGLWCALAGAAPADMPVGIAAAALGAWASLLMVPPVRARIRPGALATLLLQLPAKALGAGIAVARVALDPRRRPNPRTIAWTPRLPPGRARDAFLAYASLLPGTLPAGVGPDGTVLVHALDGEADVAAAMTMEEALFARAFGLDV
ncbi:Na+/H+ antiporter subunit E [Roseomonas sp. PWR1]|uniref:Na+/H+ antiporter subunit E n=1 Tax=Roseomonas nitratireducens TaxID=2820810 RepID=A0ABS4AXH6_9PROT|nr:Na+/H+ antiporter subunit E [Neoroseomonas nitratireducens]MBP0466056.1 Na+/H+ antiporter subunit E [Neoroseomonas nitratireducens]